jgi:flagellar protein FlgJ
MIEKILSDSLHPNPAKGTNPAKLKQACAEFESLFLNYLLKSMRSSVPEGGFVEQSEESRMFKSMLDEKLADQISTNGGLGLGEILYQQLIDRNDSSVKNEA